jgi:Protein of unknown function (DUF4238)
MGKKKQYGDHQHFISRMYLKYFANPKDQVRVYRKDGRGWWSRTDRTACERHFYEFEVAGYRSDFVPEMKFSELETKAGEIVPKLLQRQTLSRRDYLYWSMYVATLFLRTRMMREVPLLTAMQRITTDSAVREEQYQFFKNGILVPFADLKRKAEASAELLRNHPAFFHWCNVGANLSNYVQALLNKEWLVLPVTERETFITSDSPVLAGEFGDGEFGVRDGLLNPKHSIFFPLTPRALFFATPIGPPRRFKLWDQEVRMFNRVIASCAHREIYASSFSWRYQELADLISGDFNHFRPTGRAFVCC